MRKESNLKNRVLSFVLAIAMFFSLITEPTALVFAAEAQTSAIEGQSDEQQTQATSLDTSNLTFDIANPDGYVTVSFEDKGIRPENADIANAELYGTAVGTIIEATKVPFEEGDSVADVTTRLLDAMELDYSHTGTVEDGFYLEALKDFELNDTYYPTFGEFDAGAQSGWCVRWNDWHINVGSSAIEVEDGDTVSWLYTCQFGADIGADFSSKSAQINNIVFAEEYGTWSPAFDTETEEYTYEVSEDISSIAFKVELENYAAKVTLKVDGKQVTYKPNQAVQVTPDSKIEISTALDYMDAANNNQIVTYTDSIFVQLKTKNQAPAVVEGAPTSMDVTVGEEVSVDLSQLFEDADGDFLNYTVSINDGAAQAVDGSVYKGKLPAAGEYKIVITASDGMDSVSHAITVNAAKENNTAPAIKAEFAEAKGKTYVYSSSYVYIYMDDIFEDADGDALTYKATLDGEEVEVSYNSWSKEYYIQFAEKPVIKEYKIVANDGTADSEVFTATCIGTTATITPEEKEPLIPGGTYLYYVCGSAENDTFALDYTLDVDVDLQAEWTSSNSNVLTSNGDGTFTVNTNAVTSRTQLYVGVVYGKDGWGSSLYLGSKNIYILPAQPEIADITAELAEHADKQTATIVSNAVTGGWNSSEFDYTVENPSICDFTTSGTYGISVTPKALGTTKVTATFKYDESITCTFDVTVTGRSLQIKDQPGEDSVIFEKDKTVQMEVLGAQEEETFTWTSSNEDVAVVDSNGLVTVKALGTTYITAASSLSTEEEPAKISMYLQVKEDGKVYLEDLAVTDYSYFEGFISAKSGFQSATLEYDWTVNESRYTYKKLAFTPYFDDESLSAVLHYQISGTEEQTMELENGTAVNIANGLVGGNNVVTIDVYPKDNEKNVTTYTLRIFHPYNPTNTINSMTIYPNGNTALAYPTYLNYKEGTIFRYNDETDEFVTGWGGNPSTGWSSTQYTYKTFVYGERTSEISLYPVFGYANERVMIYVNGEELEEAVTSWKSKTIPVTEETMKIEFHVNSEKYHAEKLTAGVENPYEEPEVVYTLYVENVTPLGIDAKILSAELSTGSFYEPGFTSDSYTISALIPSNETSAELTFTVPKDIDVYKTSVSNANKLEAVEQDENGNNVYKTQTVEIIGTGSYAYAVTNIILQVTDAETGEVGKAQYAFTICQRGEKDVYPDRVVEYLCLGSQYTNISSYGTMPERTLKSGGGTLSLGNFGGYIVYEYDTPIENSPNNPYGVDFVIYGNSFGNGGHEPGYVQVSQDGENWYTLAGSEHYDDHNDWDYTMTYTNESGKSAWTNSDGQSGQIYNYPIASAYPYFNWTEELEQSMTVSGPRLNSSAKDAYGSAAAVLPVFGYVDVNTNGAISGTSNNPYNHPGTLVAGGDMFDLDWAVDEEGMPVELDSVSYVRVATASSIYAGAIGEKSTEVTAVNRVTNAAEMSVGETAAPTSITINGKEIAIPVSGEAKTVIYQKNDSADAVLTVEVKASEESNIYINNLGASSRSFVTVPEKGIIRIIVQEGEKAPYICYLKLDDGKELEDLEKIYTTTGKYLVTKVTDPIVNSIGGEWAVLGLARAGYEVPEDYYDIYIDNLIETLKENDGVLHARKYTEYSRVILALTSIGYDVTDVAGYNLLTYLADYNKVVWQGVNGAIWALIALDSHDYEIPEEKEAKTQTTRKNLIDFILEKQFDDGGWALSGTDADVDMTAMAIQALAPYYNTNQDVKSAVDQALITLSDMQYEDGSFGSTDGKCSESCAQVIVALTALGIDPETDSRYVKKGNSVVDALCDFYVEGGGFMHVADSSLNGMATEQSYYALAAYFRYLDEQNSLYDMNDVTIQKNECLCRNYTDLSRSDWYHDAVEYMLKNDLMNGVASDRFAPNDTTTRAMFVTVLWRMENEPTADYTITFKDVESNRYYTEAVRWAAANDIVKGYGTKTFGTNDKITREQMATILYRYAQYKDENVSADTSTELSFSDSNKISGWAKEAIHWAYSEGLMNGMGGNKMQPQGMALRCQVAQLLMRFLEQ